MKGRPVKRRAQLHVVNEAASGWQAVLYARVSSKEQEREGYSIPAQQKLLNDYAQAKGITVAREFVDVETAKQSGRVGFTAMLKYLEEQGSACRIILVEKTDRLYRNIKDWAILDPDELNVEIHFVKENVVLTPQSRSSDKLMHGTKVLMAKNYIDNLSEETRKGMQQKADEGLYPARPPVGYLSVAGQDGKNRLQLDPKSAPMITRVFEKYATGTLSLKELVVWARDEGLARKTGKPFTKAGLHHILRTPLYCGEFAWDGTNHRGLHTPLVSKELWSRVQSILSGHFEKKHRQVKHDFAFSGLISCGHCGCSLVGDIKKGKYIYYRCSGYKGDCGEKYPAKKTSPASSPPCFEASHSTTKS
jgi:DNA invertase Pin-like site-specific DNA recombinase